MARVTITFEDNQGQGADGMVDVSAEWDPPLEEGAFLTTPAQEMGMMLLEAANSVFVKWTKG